MAVQNTAVGSPLPLDQIDLKTNIGASGLGLGETANTGFRVLDPGNLSGATSDYGEATGKSIIAQGGDVFKYGQSQLGAASQTRTAAEQKLFNIENMLGQDLSRIQALDPYSIGVSGSQDTSALKAGSGAKKAANSIDREFQTAQTSINSLYQQAQAKAAAGDMAGADALKTQAQALEAQWGNRRNELLKQGKGKRVKKRLGGDAFSLTGEDTLPGEELTSQMGQSAGNLVRTGRELSEGPGSEGYERIRGELQDPALKQLDYADLIGQRQLAAGAKQSARESALASRARGGARSVLGEQALSQRSAENTAQARANLTTEINSRKAQIRGQTSEFMAKWAPAFAMDAANFGRSYAQGAPGIRESYQAAITGIASAAAQLSTSYANTLTGAGAQVLASAYAAQQKNHENMTDTAGSIIGMAACHGAAVVFGWFTPDWYRARNWICFEWKGVAAEMFRAFYLKHSRKLAWVMKNVPGMKMLWTPFFQWAALNGSDEVK